MEVWEIVIYVMLLNGTEYKQRVEKPVFPNENLCTMYTELPFFHDSLLKKYWNGDTGVAYVLSKCELNRGI